MIQLDYFKIYGCAKKISTQVFNFKCATASVSAEMNPLYSMPRPSVFCNPNLLNISSNSSSVIYFSNMIKAICFMVLLPQWWILMPK